VIEFQKEDGSDYGILIDTERNQIKLYSKEDDIFYPLGIWTFEQLVLEVMAKND